jgi:hypothetical protein
MLLAHALDYLPAYSGMLCSSHVGRSDMCLLVLASYTFSNLSHTFYFHNSLSTVYLEFKVTIDNKCSTIIV